MAIRICATCGKILKRAKKVEVEKYVHCSECEKDQNQNFHIVGTKPCIFMLLEKSYIENKMLEKLKEPPYIEAHELKRKEILDKHKIALDERKKLVENRKREMEEAANERQTEIMKRVEQYKEEIKGGECKHSLERESKFPFIVVQLNRDQTYSSYGNDDIYYHLFNNSPLSVFGKFEDIEEARKHIQLLHKQYFISKYEDSPVMSEYAVLAIIDINGNEPIELYEYVEHENELTHKID